MMTTGKADYMGLPIDTSNPMTLLHVDSCLEWLLKNTKLKFDADDLDELRALPASVKLFICRYNELYSRQLGITSESIGGMSQGFDTTDVHTQLWQLASELLRDYIGSTLKVTPAKRKWC